VIFQASALLFGLLSAHPERVEETSAWGETHAATSVLAYGALALAAVAGVMFLVLDRQLKEHHLKSGLFRTLPPVRELLVSMHRLLWLGMVLLTAGIIAGFFMPRGSSLAHLIAALIVWTAYLLLLVIKSTHGLTGRRLSYLTVMLFVISLAVFAFI